MLSPVMFGMGIAVNDDKDTAEVPINGGARPVGMAYAMRTEAEAVLNDAVFRRSPIIAKLLRFLIEETLAGRAHLLKSYTVAVDGLGRPADFDVGDSYARVQMGRLRKMLQSYYAEHGPVDELCLYLHHGSYTVKIAKLAAAYPTLYRPLSATPPMAPAGAAIQPVLADLPIQPDSVMRFRPWHAVVVTGILALLTLGLVWQSGRFSSLEPVSPILEMGPVDAGNGAEAERLARQIGSSFEHGLPRFKLARIRLSRRNPGNAYVSAQGQGLLYRMHSQIEARDDGSATLFLRLNDLRSNTLIWSREVEIPPEPRSINDAVAPLLAEIAGPHGVISMQGMIAYKDDKRGGYPCLLKYFAYLKTRDAAAEKAVATCFKKPVVESRMRATVLAARSLFALESRAARDNPTVALAEARDLASRALAADADDGSARFAMARIAYMVGDCMTARFYTQQTVDANPYSPIFMAGLAGHAPQCRYEKSRELLDRAFLVANASDTDARLLLVIAAVAQGRADRVAELDRGNMPRNGRHRLNYYLSEAIIAASQNRDSDAGMYWRQFSKMLGSEKISPEQKLQRVIQSPFLRRQVVDYLRRHDVFDRVTT